MPGRLRLTRQLPVAATVIALLLATVAGIRTMR
jgi:hypothetical protein